MIRPKVVLACNDIKRGFYVAAAEAAGMEAIPLYAQELTQVSSYDGLILCGGTDINPVHYGQTVHGAVNMDDERDLWELDFARKAIGAGKMVLGICRGHQLLNVALGGTLIQHLPEVHLHKWDKEPAIIHETTADPNSWVGRLYGEHFTVNSIHHQAIDSLGCGLRAVQWSKEGSVIEAVSHDRLPVFGVQWHPERMCLDLSRTDTVDGMKVFQYFFDTFS